MILGWLFSPLAFFMGVPWKDVLEVGYLMGVKVSMTEFIGYIELGAMREALHPRSVVIATYALCGFANVASIGIQIGGLSVIVPERRREFARIGLRAMAAGALASWQTAAIAGVLV